MARVCEWITCSKLLWAYERGISMVVLTLTAPLLADMLQQTSNSKLNPNGITKSQCAHNCCYVNWNIVYFSEQNDHSDQQLSLSHASLLFSPSSSSSSSVWHEMSFEIIFRHFLVSFPIFFFLFCLFFFLFCFSYGPLCRVILLCVLFFVI